VQRRHHRGEQAAERPLGVVRHAHNLAEYGSRHLGPQDSQV
jgi:hypothetical protein